MPPSYFPLRWESTGDQWWYASPIDWAAANGLYDVVSELLHLDTNLLIKLTSLRRIRRLETVWDDEAQFHDVAKCRAYIARKLLHDCETKRGYNSLIRTGYGGWLLYTAASAGDVEFVKELLERDPLLVFGEGEYGVTDIFYAAARSKNSEVFRLLLDFSILPSSTEEPEEKPSESDSVFKWELMNRAVHAAARGGNLEILKEILGDRSDLLVYRDMQGSTLLHTASGRGQVEIVKDLLASFDIITTTDNQGNTALHVAAYRGYLAVVEVLILSTSSMTSITNNDGDTFLHMAVAGFRTPGFRRLDQQIELVKQLVSGKIVNIQDVINIRNNNGRTALHMAVTENIQSNLVEVLMTVPSIDLNVHDDDGMTPLDLLKKRPRSASSEILIKQMVSAGGISNFQDDTARNAIVSHLKGQGISGSPGTSFRIPDAEIFLYTGIENASEASGDLASVDYSTCLSQFSDYSCTKLGNNQKANSMNYAASLKFLLRWPRRKERKSASRESVDNYPHESNRNWEDRRPIPLREMYSKSMSLPGNKRTFAIRSDLPSPSTRMRFTEGLMQGVIQATPNFAISVDSPSGPFSQSSISSPTSLEKHKDVYSPGTPSSHPLLNGKTPNLIQKQPSFNKKLMNRYFCFGAQGLAVEDSMSYTRLKQSFNGVTSLVA